MALLRIPTFDARQEVVDGQRRFTPATLRSINDAFRQIFTVVNQIVDIFNLYDQLQTAVAAAQAAADAANGAVASTKREQALVNSYIEPASVLMADDMTITITAHTRYYADGTTAMVNGATVPTTGPSVVNYVFYDDPARTGGTVAYTVDTVAPVQTGDRHVVGAVSVPAAGAPAQPGGSGPRPPGYVIP